MVYNPDTEGLNKIRLRAFLVAKLDAQQLAAVQEAFGRGACSQTPNPHHELFIQDKPEWSHLTLAEMRRTLTDGRPFLVIDDQTPHDGGVWYVDNFATEDEVQDGEAASTSVVWKIRAKIQDVPTMHDNYDVANASIREDLDNCDVDYPAQENYTQPTLFESGIDHSEHSSDRFMCPTWVTALPEEVESTTDPAIRREVLPEFEVLYRLKPEVARENGLLNRWTVGGRARDVKLKDGTVKTFPEGSLTLQMDYDPQRASGGIYKKPTGSL